MFWFSTVIIIIQAKPSNPSTESTEDNVILRSEAAEPTKISKTVEYEKTSLKAKEYAKPKVRSIECEKISKQSEYDDVKKIESNERNILQNQPTKLVSKHADVIDGHFKKRSSSPKSPPPPPPQKSNDTLITSTNSITANEPESHVEANCTVNNKRRSGMFLLELFFLF